MENKNNDIWRDDVDFSEYEETYTSVEWFDLTNPNFHIVDPDGWDRSNFTHSFMIEKITKEEFELRVSKSTCQN